MALKAKDISRYQGNFVDTGEDIVMVKITGGDAGLYVDPQAAANYQAVIRAGKAFGGYHFAGGGDPIAEANFFLSKMKPWNAGEVPALDWEIQHADPVGWVLKFVTHVHDVAGAWPLVYMNLATLKAHDWTRVFANCGLWLADWTGNPDSVIKVGYHGYVMLQYNNGPNYDHDEWEYDLETFKKYGWPAAAIPAPTPAPVADPPQPAPVPESQPTPEPAAPVADTSTATPAPDAPTDPVTTTPGRTVSTVTKPTKEVTVRSNFVKTLWNKLPDNVKRVVHTAWQVGLATFLVHLTKAHSSADVQASFVAAGSVMLSVLKSLVVK